MQETNRTEIATLGEFGLIKHLTQNIELKNPETKYGVGDDAAVLEFKDNNQVGIQGVTISEASKKLVDAGAKGLFLFDDKGQLFQELTTEQSFPIRSVYNHHS